MSHENRDNSIASPYADTTAALPAAFSGFHPPTSNTTYTPNQFFDVCLPHASRGCLRVVAYLIRKTLGWCDALGNPQREQIEVTHRELERRAGISHDMIRAALNEALSKHFIECIREGRASSAGDFGKSALYALKWDSRPSYVRSLEDFRGFYEGEGHLTDIPNEFFDRLIPRENLSVIKVVGSVIRYSIGFQAKHGGRRRHATLAYSQIMKVSGLSSRRTLAQAIREAVARNYIVRLDAGYFSARISERRSATYAVRWSDGFHAESAPTTPKRIPAGLWINPSEKDTSGLVDRSVSATSAAPKRIPADRSEKETIETKHINEKQKQAADLLRKEGFDAGAADRLAATYPGEVIRRQIEWLPQRHPSRNRAGLLRRAIEGDWPQPGSGATDTDNPQEPWPAAYREWLAQEERDCQQNRPAEYSRFAAKRERRREDILAERSHALRGRLLTSHGSEENRLEDFRRFMGLPDAHQWGNHFNN